MAIESKKKPAPKAAEKTEKAPRAPKAPVVARVVNEAAMTKGLHRRKEMTGTVVSNKMQKTIVVKVGRRVRHDLYLKYIASSKRFKAHDEKNEAKMGDIVTIIESRPLSRDKRWALQKIVRRAIQTAEANV
jgi:small subunit ribosomal protein S17